MSDIADSLVIARPTIYDYYGSREEVLIDVLREQFEQVVAGVRAATACGGPVEKLRRFVLAYYETIASTGIEKLMARSQSAASRATDRLDALRREFLQLLVDIIAEGVGEGVFRTLPPLQMALAFQGMIANTTYAAVVAGRQLEPAILAGALVDLFVRGVGTEPRGTDRSNR